MKQYLYLLVGLFLTSNLMAQNYSVSVFGTKISENDTLTHYVISDSAMFSNKAAFHNESGNGVVIKVLRTPVYIVEGSSDYYVWGNGFGPETDTSGNYIFVPAGATASDTLEYVFEPNQTYGPTLVKYTFFNVDFFDDNISFYVKYIGTATGIEEELYHDILLSDCYPNPTTNTINIDYDIPHTYGEATFTILDILGNVIDKKAAKLGPSTINFDLGNVENGLYFALIELNGKVIDTKKIIVQ